MISEMAIKNVSRIGLGTHLGSFADEDSRQYTDAIAFTVRNGITSIDTAVNNPAAEQRGM